MSMLSSINSGIYGLTGSAYLLNNTKLMKDIKANLEAENLMNLGIKIARSNNPISQEEGQKIFEEGVRMASRTISGSKRLDKKFNEFKNTSDAYIIDTSKDYPLIEVKDDLGLENKVDISQLRADLDSKKSLKTKIDKFRELRQTQLEYVDNLKSVREEIRKEYLKRLKNGGSDGNT